MKLKYRFIGIATFFVACLTAYSLYAACPVSSSNCSSPGNCVTRNGQDYCMKNGDGPDCCHFFVNNDE